MKLLMVGAGYVGKALLNNLQKYDHEIYVTTTQADNVECLKPYAKEVIVLRSSYDLVRVVLTCEACILLVAPKKGSSYEDTYLDTAKIISSALKEKNKPFYLLYTSSSSVYEGIEQELATEDLILTPKSEKAKILLKTESLLLNCATTCVLRLGGIFGPGREISKRALALQGKEMAGTGEEPTNHIHLNDIVKAIIFCLDNHLEGIYNLVNNEHPKRKELYSCYFNSTIKDPDKNYKVLNNKIKSAGFTFPMQSIESS